MAGPHDDAAVQEALTTIQDYLSDRIPPLLTSASAGLLLDRPVELVASEIQSWIAAQHGRGSSQIHDAEYAYHAMKKLHDLGQLKLIPSRPLEAYLKSLEPLLLELCPEEERGWLKQNLASLEHAETVLAPAVSLIHRPLESNEMPSAGQRAEGALESDEGSARRGRRVSLMLERLQQESPAMPAGPPQVKEDRISQAIATAAASAGSEADLKQIQNILTMIGDGSGTAQVFRRLSQSLPGWRVPVGVEPGVSQVHNSSIAAMRRVLALAENRTEVNRRFTELVQSAIEQFNSGSLAKAVTMLELSESLAVDHSVDSDIVAHLHRNAHESLDLAQLRVCAEKPEKHHLLKRVLDYFHGFSPERLFDTLQGETRRDRRRLMLKLLEAHGQDARTAALARLESLGSNPEVAGQWYLLRNLITVLTRIPPPETWERDSEIKLAASFLHLSYPAPLVREAITLLGQIRHPSAEQLLVGMLGETERALLETKSSDAVRTGLFSILDRLVSTLARYGTPKAYQAVINHGLRREEGLGDTLGRLSYLSAQDLSTDEQSTARLVSALKTRIPKRILGMVIQRDTEGQSALIKALSSTPAPVVRDLLEQIAAHFAGKELGKAASKTLHGFAENHQGDAPPERLLGDLELFGLPDLLRQFVRSELTGTLTLKDSHGEAAGVINLRNGQLEDCRAGQLEGKAAVYHLLINPIPGTFVFMGRKHAVGQETSGLVNAQDLTPLIQEGMKRYDDLQRARTLVPDGCHLKAVGPDPRSDEVDAEFFHRLWRKVKAGATPEECEAESPSDACRVRLILARWVEDSVLALQYESNVGTR